MKKALAMLLALVMVLSLAACGGGNDETKAPADKTEAPADKTQAGDGAEDSDWLGTEDGKTITLKFWGGVQPEYGYDALCANFNEQYKDRGLQVEYTRYVNDDQGNMQLETYLMGGGEVDLFMGYGGRSRLDSRAQSNLIMDMADMLKDRGFDLIAELGEANMASYRYDDGSVYGFPTKYENGRWLLINVDMFKAAGLEIPYDGWTYSEFLAAAEKLTTGEGQDKVYGVHWFANTGNAKAVLNSVLGAYGIYKDDTLSTVNYDHKVWKEGFQLVMDTLNGGWAIPIEDHLSEKMTVANTFLSGKCAITTNVSQMRLCMDTKTYPHEFVTALVPGPVPDGAEYNTEFYRSHAATTGAGDLICIAAKTEYPEQCMEFALWYTQGGMAPLAKGGRIPLWTGTDKSLVTAEIKANAGEAIDLKSMEAYLSVDNTKGIKGAVSSVDSELNQIWSEEFEAMCYGRQTVDETIKNMIDRSNQKLADAAKK